MKNLILIGMPGSGKSTVGVILAKTLGTVFVDTDLIIQVQRRNKLQRIIDLEGIERFLSYEAEALLSVSEEENTVIATGGSAVFSEKAMLHLKKNGICVYLDVSVPELTFRLSNIKTRGIACRRGEGIDEIYNERKSFYEKFCDVKIDCDGKTAEQIVERIIKCVEHKMF